MNQTSPEGTESSRVGSVDGCCLIEHQLNRSVVGRIAKYLDPFSLYRWILSCDDQIVCPPDLFFSVLLGPEFTIASTTSFPGTNLRARHFIEKPPEWPRRRACPNWSEIVALVAQCINNTNNNDQQQHDMQQDLSYAESAAYLLYGILRHAVTYTEYRACRGGPGSVVQLHEVLHGVRCAGFDRYPAHDDLYQYTNHVTGERRIQTVLDIADGYSEPGNTGDAPWGLQLAPAPETPSRCSEMSSDWFTRYVQPTVRQYLETLTQSLSFSLDVDTQLFDFEMCHTEQQFDQFLETGVVPSRMERSYDELHEIAETEHSRDASAKSLSSHVRSLTLHDLTNPILSWDRAVFKELCNLISSQMRSEITFSTSSLKFLQSLMEDVILNGIVVECRAMTDFFQWGVRILFTDRTCAKTLVLVGGTDDGDDDDDDDESYKVTDEESHDMQ